MDVLDLVNDTNRVGPGHDIMVRPFVCAFPGCKKAFARKSDLARHFRIHTNERPFHCLHRGCGKSFIQRSALTVHIRTHTGERPHVCEACEKTFADSSSLARHRRIHTGKRPYLCKAPGCGRSFARKVTHGKHYRSAHPDQPPLSHDMTKPSIPSPLYTADRLASGGPIVQPGPPDAAGIPQYWITTPADSAPHAYAVSSPSEGSAYHPGGKKYKPKAKAGVKPKSKCKRDSQPGGFGIGNNNSHTTETREGKLYISPAETEPTTSIGTPLSCSSQHSELHEIHSSYSVSPEPLFEIGSDDKHLDSDFTWSTATGTDGASAGVGISATADQATDLGITPQPPSYVAPVSTPTPLPVIPESGASPLDLGPSQHSAGGLMDSDIGDYASPFVPNAFADYPHPQRLLHTHFSKSASHEQLRAASNPEISKPTFAPYGGGLGGGFSVNQVSIPAGMLQPIDTRAGADRSVSAPMSWKAPRDPDNNSPELVDVNSVPDFSFQPPAGPAVHMPYSAVDGFTNPLTHAPPQLFANTNLPATAQAGRLHSAPPHLQRFSSLPNVPTISTWDTTPSSATSSTFGPAPTPDLEMTWVNLELQPQAQAQSQSQPLPMLPQMPPQHHTMSLPSPAIATPAAPAPSPAPGLLKTEPLRTAMWSSPIAFPNPPHPHIIQRNPFAPTPPPAQQQQSFQPYCTPGAYSNKPPPGPPQFTHYQPQFQRTPSSLGYGPSPISPNPLWQTYRTHSQPVSALGSPASIQHFPHSRISSENEQNVLLTTPPRMVSQTSINNVGLGISNVHFDEDRTLPSPAAAEEEEEGEPELDSLDEYIIDDSDDEFIPGGKGKKSKKKHKKKGSIKAAAAKKVK